MTLILLKRSLTFKTTPHVGRLDEERVMRVERLVVARWLVFEPWLINRVWMENHGQSRCDKRLYTHYLLSAVPRPKVRPANETTIRSYPALLYVFNVLKKLKK